MQLKKYFLVIFIFLAIESRIVAQKRSFDKIEFASFDVNSMVTQKKNVPYISLYSSIDKNGIVKFIDIDDNNKSTFFSYVLSSDQLRKIRSIFDPAKKLRTYMSAKKTGGMYGGSYNFYYVRYQNGIQDSLCTIFSFMSKGFMEVYDMLFDIYIHKKDKKIPPFKIPNIFRKQLLSTYKKSKSYLPKIEYPGSFR